MTARLRVHAVLLAGVLAMSVLASPAAAAGRNTHRQTHAVPRFHPPIIPAGWPQVLSIPRLRVRASVEDLDLRDPKYSTAPLKWNDVAWYDRGPKPGELGRAAIFGHVDSTCCPAAFYLIRDLKKGDMLQVGYKKGKPVNFRVQWVATYPNNQVPTKFLWGPNRARGLALITCTGVYHLDGTGYDHRLVVYATYVS
jgi:sortase A